MKNKLKYMVLIGIIAIITVPVLLMAFYAVPYNDDFPQLAMCSGKWRNREKVLQPVPCY